MIGVRIQALFIFAYNLCVRACGCVCVCAISGPAHEWRRRSILSYPTAPRPLLHVDSKHMNKGYLIYYNKWAVYNSDIVDWISER